MEIRPFDPRDTEVVIALWEETGLVRPWNDPQKDIARKLAVQPELFLVGIKDGAVIATAMGGYDGHRGSVYYLAIAPGHQSQGYGTALLEALEEKLTGMGCPKLNLMVRSGNVAAARFYEKNGYAIEQSACWGKRLIPD